MKAIVFTRPLPVSDPACLVEIELPKPKPAGRDLLVKIEAVAVNPTDTKRRRDPAKTDDKPKVLGFDAAGTVEAVGEAVTLFKPGDEVYYAGDATRPGCNSEFHLVDERVTGRKPKTLDFAQAAAIPLTAITAWESFFDRMKIDAGGKHRGASILIIGGAGGVGSMGIQLAKIAGLNVIATASRPESVAWAKRLGADHVVDHRKALAPQVAAFGKKDVEYIANFADLDPHWEAMAELIAPQGYMVAIVGNSKPFALDAIRQKSASFCWELMFTRPRYQTPDMIEQHRLLNRVSAWLDDGTLKGTLRETLSPINAANLRAAHAKIESGTTIGKIALRGW